METASLEAESLLSGAQGSEILSSSWHNIGAELHERRRKLVTNLHFYPTFEHILTRRRGGGWWILRNVVRVQLS